MVSQCQKFRLQTNMNKINPGNGFSYPQISAYELLHGAVPMNFKHYLRNFLMKNIQMA